MANGKFISYLRVSTARQGESGLGLEAQRAAVTAYLNSGKESLIREIVEIESGKRSDRPALAIALKLCRQQKATLVIAKLDRLARNVHFISGLMEAGVEFVAVDMPHANRLTVHILAAVAEDEAHRISQRTKEALAAAKARGTRLGGRRVSAARFAAIAAEGRKVAAKAAALRRNAYAPAVREARSAGATSLRELAAHLNNLNVEAPRGGAWSAGQVHRLMPWLDSRITKDC